VSKDGGLVAMQVRVSTPRLVDAGLQCVEALPASGLSNRERRGRSGRAYPSALFLSESPLSMYHESPYRARHAWQPSARVAAGTSNDPRASTASLLAIPDQRPAYMRAPNCAHIMWDSGKGGRCLVL